MYMYVHYLTLAMYNPLNPRVHLYFISVLGKLLGVDCNGVALHLRVCETALKQVNSEALT